MVKEKTIAGLLFFILKRLKMLQISQSSSINSLTSWYIEITFKNFSFLSLIASSIRIYLSDMEKCFFFFYRNCNVLEKRKIFPKALY